MSPPHSVDSKISHTIILQFNATLIDGALLTLILSEGFFGITTPIQKCKILEIKYLIQYPKNELLQILGV